MNVEQHDAVLTLLTPDDEPCSCEAFGLAATPFVLELAADGVYQNRDAVNIILRMKPELVGMKHMGFGEQPGSDPWCTVGSYRIDVPGFEPHTFRMTRSQTVCYAEAVSFKPGYISFRDLLPTKDSATTAA